MKLSDSLSKVTQETKIEEETFEFSQGRAKIRYGYRVVAVRGDNRRLYAACSSGTLSYGHRNAQGESAVIKRRFCIPPHIYGLYATAEQAFDIAKEGTLEWLAETYQEISV